MMETPHVDAAVRAGCPNNGQCSWPSFFCNTQNACEPARISLATLRAAFPWTPGAETIEAMIIGMLRDDPIALSILTQMELAETALAAYRHIPIVRELSPDLANVEPPGDDE